MPIIAGTCTFPRVPDSACSTSRRSSALAAPPPAGRPLVIVVETDTSEEVPGYDAWWDVPVAEVSESRRVRDAYRTYTADLARERHRA